MKSRFWAGILLALWAPQFGRTQSVIQTEFSAVSNGVPERLASLSVPSAITVAADGTLYVALKGTHQVVRIVNGQVWLVAGNGQSGSTGDGAQATSATLMTPVSLALDASGNLYIADSQAGRVRCVGVDGVIRTLAGNGKSAYTGDGGPAVQASLNNPTAVAVDPNGNVLIADTGNNVVRRVTPSGQIATFAGTGASGIATTTGAARSNPLHAPAGVVADSAGDVYIADTGNSLIQKVTPDGTMARYAGTLSSFSPFGGGGDPNSALGTALASPTVLALDSAGNLYFMEYAKVLRVTTDGKVASCAGTGVGGKVGDGGLARYADIDVMGIALDASGNLLIADGYNNRLRIVTASDGLIETFAGSGQSSLVPQGMVLSGNNLYFSDSTTNQVWRVDLTGGEPAVIAGAGGVDYAEDDTPAASTTLNAPQGLALDASGNLYIADSKNNVVRRVTPDGKITTVAGNGNGATAGDGGSATSASLNMPYAVAVDTQGNLFIAERNGHVVRKVSTSGTISTVAGTGVAAAPSAETGNALSQPLNTPQGLTMESAGTLLIADTGNSRVRRLSSDGSIQTVAGSSSAGSSGDGGQATSATLINPTSVATDAAGNLYITDVGSQNIRRVDPNGLISTIAGNGKYGYNGDGSPATAYSIYSPSTIVSYSGCSQLIADTRNQRIRRLWPATNYTIATNPAGLAVTVDGQLMTTPAVVQLLPGTTHAIDAPSPQAASTTVRYISPGAQQLAVSCGPARASYTLSFAAQYALSVVADDGGSVSPGSGWQNAGTGVTLQASPKSGYVFTGWEGACSGTGTCMVAMDGPKTVKADFAPTQTQKGVTGSNAVMGAGMSTPPVTALSPNALAIITGSNFAPSGTMGIADTAHLVDGQISTELDGVCILAGGIAAPVLAVTPAQINFQTPQLPVGTTQVQVVTGCGSASELRSDAVSVTVQTATPEFFYFVRNDNGQNPIAAVNVNTGTNVGKPGLLAAGTFVPAKPGDVLVLYATGLGATSPAFTAGAVPDRAAPVTAAVRVTMGAVQVPAEDILYVGVTPSSAGLYQVNVQVPDAVPDGDQQVQVWIGGIASPAGPYITVQR